jgi:hypothetical protein
MGEEARLVLEAGLLMTGHGHGQRNHDFKTEKLHEKRDLETA